MSDSQDILVPDIGDFDSVDVIEVLVSPGDTVDVESPLILSRIHISEPTSPY